MLPPRSGRMLLIRLPVASSWVPAGCDPALPLWGLSRLRGRL